MHAYDNMTSHMMPLPAHPGSTRRSRNVAFHFYDAI